jgi:hypothetical protein
MNLLRSLAATAASLMMLGAVGAQVPGGPEGPPRESWIVPHFETGVVKVLFHEYRSGPEATNPVFDYVNQGGQEILFPYQRLSVDFHLGTENIVTLLYQPLTLTTRTVAQKNGTAAVSVDGVDFASLPLDLIYGFDFWRASWLYNFAQGRGEILGAGVSLQARNASISFTSTDGSKRAISQNLGLVPILKTRWAHWFTPDFGLDTTADGFYASSALFNGATKPFEGWIWDVSVSAKTRLLPGAIGFATVRSIGGGARGENAYSTTQATVSTNPQSYNALATAAFTLGLELE